MAKLTGSERQAPEGAREISAVDPAQIIEVTLLLRRRAPLAAGRLTRAELREKHGATPGDVALVERFAHAQGLTVLAIDAGARTVRLAGPSQALQRAFGADLRLFEKDGHRFRGRTGALTLPDALDGVVQAVLGLDDRVQARCRWRARHEKQRTAAQDLSLTPLQVAAAYSFPGGTDGTGECIAIVELNTPGTSGQNGAGYEPADLAHYFASLKVKAPAVTAVSVDGGKNLPGTNPDADGEVVLDIEVAGAVANGASIAVYFAPNTDAGFVDAVKAAVHDEERKPSVISISWGSPEDGWTAQARAALDEALQDAAAVGVTVCVAAGDHGSGDGESGDHADFPASSPHALACGGTRLQGASETVWNDGDGWATGGGFSAFFAQPEWQSGGKMRGLPDVAGNADPETGYRVFLAGKDAVIGGTSAVAPLWAALVARLNQGLGASVGLLQPRLAPLAAKAFRDVTQGSNGTYSAAAGWDACTGWGSPNGEALFTALRATQA